MKSIDSRLDALFSIARKRGKRGLSHERRKHLTDRAVLHGDQDALAELNLHRPEKINASREQRDAALAAGLRCLEEENEPLS
jgi:hypothetical protein